MELRCKQCDKKFSTYPYLLNRRNRKFCSRNCSNQWVSKNLRGEQHGNWAGRIKKNCKYCGKRVFARLREVKKGYRKFCNKFCYGKWLSENLKGKNSPSWKGGKEFWSTRNSTHDEYKIWRKKVFERDNYRCLICSKVGGCLNAHHIKNWASYPELRYDIDNGMTMCEDCHKLVDKELPLFSIKRNKVKSERIF